MSLFGMLMGDVDDDPFLGGHMRRMDQMMNSFFRDPFGDIMGGPPGLFPELMPPPSAAAAVSGRHGGARGHHPHPHAHPHHHPHHHPHSALDFPGRAVMPHHGPASMMAAGAMSPFGAFPNFRHMFDMANQGAANGGQFSSMTQVMTMTQGPDGRPQIYQASTSTHQGPNGVRETKKTVADSRTGVKKMAIGHHIGERAHIIEKEQNVYSGEREEREDFINLDEDEAESFNQEWQERTRGLRGNQSAIGYGGRRGHHRGQARHSGDNGGEQLALPAPSNTPKSGGASKQFRAQNPLSTRRVTSSARIPLAEQQSTSRAAQIASKRRKNDTSTATKKRRDDHDSLTITELSDSDDSCSSAADVNSPRVSKTTPEPQCTVVEPDDDD